ncbi:hypothetical protein BG003_006220 [Podila horticola]|nr:hypothetical protein BG003_006220 [Podila horticola]
MLQNLGWVTGGNPGSSSQWKIHVHVDLITPKIFSGKVRKAPGADANHADLLLLSPFFCRLGIKCLDLLVADDQGLEMILNSSFKERLTATMDIAQFGNRLEQTELSGKLDVTEKKSICNTSDRSPSSHLLA